MKKIKKLALVICALVTIVITNSCNKTKEESTNEKLIGTWKVESARRTMYDKGNVLNSTDLLKQTLQSTGVSESLFIFQNNTLSTITGEYIVTYTLSISNNKLILSSSEDGLVEWEMSWEGRDKLTLTERTVYEGDDYIEGKGDLLLRTMVLTRVKTIEY